MATTILLICAFLVFHGLIRLYHQRELPAVLESLRAGGAQYLLLGALVAAALRTVDVPAEVSSLQSGLLVACVVWMGFQAGLAFDLRRLQQPTSDSLLSEGLQAILCFVLVFAAVSASGFYFEPELSVQQNLPVAALLLAAAAVSHRHPEPAVFWRRKPGWLPSVSPPPSRFANSLGLLFLGLFLPFVQDRTLISIGFLDTYGSFGGLITLVGMGLLLGVVADFAFRANPIPIRALLILLGAVAIVSGSCHSMNLPAVSIGFIGGTWFINTTVRRREAIELIDRAGALIEPMLLVLLGGLFVTAFIDPDAPNGWVINPKSLVVHAFSYLGIRTLSRCAAAVAVRRSLGQSLSLPRILGSGLRPLGPLSVAIIAQGLFLPLGTEHDTMVAGALLTVHLSQTIFIPPDTRPATGALVATGSPMGRG